MPERWERELRKLRAVEVDEPTVRERVERGPSEHRRASRRNPLVAGVVAGAVTIGGIAVLWQLSPNYNANRVGGQPDLPTLLVTFESNGTIEETPSDAEPILRVDTRLAYGDTVEEDFTSTTPAGAHVDWAGVEDVTRFVPGPTTGSPVRIQADGENARVLLGRPADWPEFERFAPIEELPQEPGDYVLIFEAEYPEGVARTARFVSTVSPGVLQLVVTEGKSLYAATALAYLDGTRADGFLSSSSFTLGDVEAESDPAAPHFESDAWLEVPPGSPVLLVSTVSRARAGVFERYEDFSLEASLASDLLADAPVLESSAGRHLLAVDVTWRHGPHPLRDEPTQERAVFFFPIEIVPAAEKDPSVEPVPSQSPARAGAVSIDIRRTSEETGDPEAIARLGEQEVRMCPDNWTVVNPGGTEESVIFDCGQTDVFRALVGTPITVAGDFATVNVSTRVSGDQVPGSSDVVPALDAGSILTLGYEVTWDDGSEASFWLLLTVQGTGPTTEEPGIVVRIEGLGERSTDVPTITMTYKGETKRGCTVAFEWILGDGTRIDEGSGGGRLPMCDSEPLFEVPPGIPITLVAPTAIEVFTTHTTTPLYTGIDSVGMSVTWANGNGEFIAYFEVRGEPGTAQIILDCPTEDRVPFSTPDGPRILPGGSAYIRGNMTGFLQTDVIEQMTREPGGDSEWDGVWQVVRDGSVIAAVEFDELSGVACRGSGIGGV